MEFLRFKHARFSARFPRDYRYSPSHYWMAPVTDAPGLWRVGFTKFATRMLGELVEANFEIPVGGKIEAGQEIGAVEGFKAASSVFSGASMDAPRWATSSGRPDRSRRRSRKG